MNAETVAIGLFLLGIVVSVIGFFLVRLVLSTEKTRDRVEKHQEKLAVMEAKIPEHGTRLQALEVLAGELKGDVREMKGDVRRIARWVDLQASPERNRRGTDNLTKEG